MEGGDVAVTAVTHHNNYNMTAKLITGQHQCLGSEFFADPDPYFKTPDLDLSGFCFNKLMGTKLCYLVRFWRNLTKKYSLESAKYDIQFFYLYLHWLGVFCSWIRIFWPIRTQQKKANIKCFHIKSRYCSLLGTTKVKPVKSVKYFVID